MPRPIRPDLRPTILLPDMRTPRSRAMAAVGSNVGVSVYPKGQIRPHHKTYTSFHDHLDVLREWDVRIDHEVLTRMLAYLDFADARAIGEPNENGLVPHIVHVPGCRIALTQQKIAEKIGCSEERVRKAIKIFKETYIIMNSGNGWYDFSADFFWKGKEEIRIPYKTYQERMVFPPIEILGGSKALAN